MPEAEKWQYKCCEFDDSTAVVDEVLARWANHGWELVTATAVVRSEYAPPTHYLYWRRPVT